jgi:hypothetical protein
VWPLKSKPLHGSDRTTAATSPLLLLLINLAGKLVVNSCEY